MMTWYEATHAVPELDIQSGDWTGIKGWDTVVVTRTLLGEEHVGRLAEHIDEFKEIKWPDTAVATEELLSEFERRLGVWGELVFCNEWGPVDLQRVFDSLAFVIDDYRDMVKKLTGTEGGGARKLAARPAAGVHGPAHER